MDGMSYFGRDSAEAAREKAAEQREVRNGLLISLASIVVTIWIVLALDRVGFLMPVADEFAAKPVLSPVGGN